MRTTFGIALLTVTMAAYGQQQSAPPPESSQPPAQTSQPQAQTLSRSPGGDVGSGRR